MINEAVRHGGGNNFIQASTQAHFIVPFLLITINNPSTRIRHNIIIFQGCEARLKEKTKISITTLYSSLVLIYLIYITILAKAKTDADIEIE